MHRKGGFGGFGDRCYFFQVSFRCLLSTINPTPAGARQKLFDFDFIILFLSPVRGTLADYSFCSCPLSSFSFSAFFVSFTFLGSTLSAFFGSHSMGR
jgi:hypothetical protein